MTPHRSLHFAVGALLALASSVAFASPAECPESDRPVVELVLDVEPPDRYIATSLDQHLRAELRMREIDVCEGPLDSRKAIARVLLHIDRPTAGPVIATIQLGDRITDKRVERTVDLTHIPSDGRPLAVASSADELLRASWAELLVKDAPPPLVPPPPPVVRALADTVARPAPPRPAGIDLGGSIVGTTFPGHYDALGGVLLGRYWFVPRVAAILQAGADFGFERASANGSIRATGFSGGLGLAFALTPHTSRLGVDLEVGVAFARMSFVPAPLPGVTGTTADDWACLARGGLRGWLASGPLRWTIGVAAVPAVRPTRALDTGQNAASIEGLGAEVGLGVMLVR